ncbi:ABC transporter ATP-binding protein [Mesorhizobium loti]|uniref:ABC transporter ATP-binding protein n=1 Tax=Rhizobium loti TaxID=381 RepID=UPI0004B52C41|nr:ATP-binding cassette domain-containing protein [Mesorhizobium loti]
MKGEALGTHCTDQPVGVDCQRKRAFDDAARLLQISHLLDRRPANLSGGKRQRVAMGRAIVRDLELFLFDEPLSNLNAKLRVEMRTEIKRLHERLGTSIVYVTHDQIEAMTLATKVAVMKGGHIQQFADPRTIYERPANVFVASFIGSPAMNFLPGVWSRTRTARISQRAVCRSHCEPASGRPISSARSSWV